MKIANAKATATKINSSHIMVVRLERFHSLHWDSQSAAIAATILKATGIAHENRLIIYYITKAIAIIIAHWYIYNLCTRCHCCQCIFFPFAVRLFFRLFAVVSLFSQTKRAAWNQPAQLYLCMSCQSSTKINRKTTKLFIKSRNQAIEKKRRQQQQQQQERMQRISIPN